MKIDQPYSCLAICLLVQMAGCSYGYRATGSLDGQSVVLAGKADLRNSGGGQFTLISPDNHLICEGHAEPPEPSSQSECAGESGKGHLRCSDGSVFALTWKAITCRAFEGSGRDEKGKTMHFTVKRNPF